MSDTPFSDWIEQEVAPKKRERTTMEDINHKVAVTNFALSPYATAAAVGGAAGAPFAGVGAAPGAAIGVTALGLGDLATGGYNLLGHFAGWPRVPLPSETIQNKFVDLGMAQRPETPGEQVYADIVQGATGGLTNAYGAMNAAARMGKYTPWVVSSSAGRPLAQTMAGAGGAAVPSFLMNYGGVSNPWLLTGASLAGSMAGGRAVPKNIPWTPSEDLRAAAKANYTAMEQAGVRIAQPSLSRLRNDIETELSSNNFIAGQHPAVRKQLGILAGEFRGPVSFQRLDALRSDIMSAARSTNNDRTRMYLQNIGGKIGDFLANLQPGQTTAGNTVDAAARVAQARKYWKLERQTNAVEGMIDRATNASQRLDNPIPLGQGMRKEFGTLMNDKKRFSRLEPDLQRAIKEVVNGTPTQKGLRVLALFAPSRRHYLMGMAEGGAVAGAWMAGHPELAPLVIGAAGAGEGAKMSMNRMSVRGAERARSIAAGGKPQTNRMLTIPAAVEATRARSRGQSRQETLRQWRALVR